MTQSRKTYHLVLHIEKRVRATNSERAKEHFIADLETESNLPLAFILLDKINIKRP